MRLISWAYITFVEAAEPSIRIVARLGNGVRVRVDGLTAVRSNVAALRTFEQHRLDVGSSHDKETISLACDWYDRACGHRQPENEDFERCIAQLLAELVAALETVGVFLRAVATDEFRDLIVRQWRNLAEQQWPKHRYETLVAAVIDRLGRRDLRPEVVTQRLLSSMQQTLAATSDDVDREAVILAHIERQIREEFPREMPIDGRDIVAMGVPPSAKVGNVLGQLKAHFAANDSSREELLVLARQLIESDSHVAQ
jgi:hypothetical protein